MHLPAHFIQALAGLLLLLPAITVALPSNSNSTYLNPVLPGWHSDPSCIRVSSTFFCVFSSFRAFPGLPIYASDDLIHWRLISHAWSRPDQIPGSPSWNTTGTQGGHFAATLRYHNGEFFLVCAYLNAGRDDFGVLYRTTDLFSDESWSDAIWFDTYATIDPDLFWDPKSPNSTLYVATAGIQLQILDPSTGATTPPISVWNGTGGVAPEGPHLYFKDDWYYLLIAEGGTELGHSVTMARSRSIEGPYDAAPGNPLLTATNTTSLFQTVGHADLFQDEEGRWWGMALTTRSGPEWAVYPMGRESALFPASWENDEFPVMDPVRGRMEGWKLPGSGAVRPPGEGPLGGGDDMYDFSSGEVEELPRNLIYPQGVPPAPAEIKKGKQAGLLIPAGRSNLTGDEGAEDLGVTGQHGIPFLGRKQEHTFFRFEAHVKFEGEGEEEAGVAVWLTQRDHINLGIVRLENGNSTAMYRNTGAVGLESAGKKENLYFRFQTESTGNGSTEHLVQVPRHWGDKPIRLHVETPSNSSYVFSASSDDESDKMVIGEAPAGIVSAGSGSFVGSLVGTYATCNGSPGKEEGSSLCEKKDFALFDKWRYEGLGQQISMDEVVGAGYV